YPCSRQYALVRHPEGLATISATSFTEAFNSNKYSIVIRDSDGSIKHTINVAERFAGDCPLLVTPDAQRLYLSIPMAGIIPFDLRSGKQLESLTPELYRDGLSGKSCMSSDGSWILAVAHDTGALIRDLNQQRWIARLRLPEIVLDESIAASPDRS